jgi:hypothetical protein
MAARSFSWVIVVLSAVAAARAQAPAAPASTAAPAWRPVGTAATEPFRTELGVSTAAPAPATALAGPAASTPGTPVRHSPLRISNGNGTLPNSGQVWREYDISPYTSRVTSTKRPEQAVVDWILRETGYEAWHGEPLGVLSANAKVLRVYHTPQMQAVVADIVERFVNTDASARAFSLRVMTVDSPNWRARAQRLLRPVPVHAPGAGAWVLAKEEAAVFMADLERRNDYHAHSSPHLLVSNGQATVVSALRGRSYVRDITARPEIWPGYETQNAQLDEGLLLEFSPLMSLDGQMIDATVKCDIDQVEKMIPVVLDATSPAAPRQRARIDVPQMVHFRFHERFRWPTEQVLLVSLGMVAMPVPADSRSLVAGIPLPLPGNSARTELLVLIESKPAAAAAPAIVAAPGTPAPPAATLATPPRDENAYRIR